MVTPQKGEDEAEATVGLQTFRGVCVHVCVCLYIRVEREANMIDCASVTACVQCHPLLFWSAESWMWIPRASCSSQACLPFVAPMRQWRADESDRQDRGTESAPNDTDKGAGGRRAGTSRVSKWMRKMKVSPRVTALRCRRNTCNQSDLWACLQKTFQSIAHTHTSRVALLWVLPTRDPPLSSWLLSLTLLMLQGWTTLRRRDRCSRTQRYSNGGDCCKWSGLLTASHITAERLFRAWRDVGEHVQHFKNCIDVVAALVIINSCACSSKMQRLFW